MACSLHSPLAAMLREAHAAATESADDPTRIYVEVAGPAYLAAPAP